MSIRGMKDLDLKVEGTFGITQLQFLILQRQTLRPRMGKKVT